MHWLLHHWTATEVALHAPHDITSLNKYMIVPSMDALACRAWSQQDKGKDAGHTRGSAQ